MAKLAVDNQLGAHTHTHTQSPKVAKAAHFLSELVGNYDTEKLCQACHELANIINEGTIDVVHSK